MGHSMMASEGERSNKCRRLRTSSEREEKEDMIWYDVG